MRILTLRLLGNSATSSSCSGDPYLATAQPVRCRSISPVRNQPPGGTDGRGPTNDHAALVERELAGYDTPTQRPLAMGP